MFIFRKYHLSTLKLADIVAPSIAVGLCLGRFGCFLNGCCYGQVACPACLVIPVTFPLSAPAREGLVEQGYQTAAGFTLAREDDHPRDGARVGKVEPDSLAYANGLRSGDVIVEMRPVAPKEDPHVLSAEDLIQKLVYRWPRGKKNCRSQLSIREPNNRRNCRCSRRRRSACTPRSSTRSSA